MENQELKTALDLFANPKLLKGQLEKDLETTNEVVKEMPKDEIENISDELLRGLAESLDSVNPQYQKIRQKLAKKNGLEHRDLTQAIHLAGEAYKIVKDNWGELFFILSMLNNKGYLDTMKKNPKLKTFFKTLFDK